jgi:peptide chain release factor subunit 3
MIDAVSRADVGILIVSARCGEFEAGFKGGQTKEHLLLLKSGNVENVIVLVNKMDECNWEKERFLDISAKITKFSKNLFKDITVIPVRGYQGDNIKNRKDLPYYSRPSFLEYLDSIKADRSTDLSPSMLVLEKVKTYGNVIFYIQVDSGCFVSKTDYRILPL